MIGFQVYSQVLCNNDRNLGYSTVILPWTKLTANRGQGNKRNFGDGNRTPSPTIILYHKPRKKKKITNLKCKYIVERIVETDLERFLQVVLEVLGDQ